MKIKNVKECIEILERPEESEYCRIVVISLVLAVIGIFLSCYISYISNPEYRLVYSADSWKIDIKDNFIPFQICFLVSLFLFLIPMLFCCRDRDLNVIHVCALTFVASIFPFGIVIWSVAIISALCSFFSLNIFSCKKMLMCFLMCLGLFLIICYFNKNNYSNIIVKINQRIDREATDAIGKYKTLDCFNNLPVRMSIKNCVEYNRAQSSAIRSIAELRKIPIPSLKQRILTSISDTFSYLFFAVKRSSSLRRVYSAEDELRNGIAPNDFIKNINSSAPHAILYLLYRNDF